MGIGSDTDGHLWINTRDSDTKRSVKPRPTRSSSSITAGGSPTRTRVIDLFGYEPSELVGEPIEILVPESVRAEHVAKRDAYIADP